MALNIGELIKENLPQVSENSGPVLSSCLTKIQEWKIHPTYLTENNIDL